MRGVIYVTDRDWFEFLSVQQDVDEVSFWRPSDTRPPQLAVGAHVIFKLRKRHGGRIVGFGVFAKHKVLPAWLAWDTFGIENGAPSFSEMRDRIERLRQDRSEVASSRGDYMIGCIMLSQPVFFHPDDW